MLITILSLLFAWPIQCIGSESFPLVEDGAARAVVVIPDDPYPIAVYAAEELVEHIMKSTEVRLSVVEESAVEALRLKGRNIEKSGVEERGAGVPVAIRSEYKVFVGSTRNAQSAGIDVSSMEPESFEIRREGNSLFIAGEDGPGDPLSERHAYSGTLFGVYDFLNQEMGVRWLWPGELGTYIPKHSSLQVYPESRTVDLQFQWQTIRQGIVNNDPRIGFTEEGLQAYRETQSVFLRRHRMNNSRIPSFGHGFGGWWEKYGEDHPKWFFQNEDGRRGPLPGAWGFVQRNTPMCVSTVNFIIKFWRCGKES